MRFLAALSLLFITSVVVNASGHEHGRSLGFRHWHSRRHSLIKAAVLEKKSSKKRCSRRDNSSPSPKPPTSSKHDNNTNNSSEGSSFIGKLLNAHGSCGPSDAIAKTTETKGPNGSIQFLNCGIDGEGWNPPHIDIKDVVVKPLSEAIKSPNSPFKACKEYVGLFNKYGAQYNIPPIFLASFAMQESSCKPDTVGGAGEQGLMQITKDKCGGAPGGNCRDPDFNIHMGAKYFASTLDDVGGDLLLAIGRYNGWSRGLTISKAEAAKKNGCCRCQQNLDYLHQFLNGWCQNINAYDVKLGLYFNLAECPV